jgi:TPR repeat protein
MAVGLSALLRGAITGAIAAYRKAAEAGYPDAMAKLAWLQVQLQPPDLDGARHWWEQAAEAGHTNAMTNLAALLASADTPDLDGARHWYEQAAQAGNTDAMVALAELLARQDSPDLDGAQYWCEQAAQAGRADAMVGLGLLRAAQDPPDRDGARGWWQQAADAGDPDAMIGVATIQAAEGDVDSARTMLLRAVDAGRSAAHDYAPVLDGNDAVRDAAVARLRDLGDDTDALNFLGIAALRAGSPDQARVLWTRSADTGDGVAPLLLTVVSQGEG